MESDRHSVRVEISGPRPPCFEVAQHLWGRNINVDSDGNSASPADQQWTELTFKVVTSSPALAWRAAVRATMLVDGV
jgi:hypothetical protein